MAASENISIIMQVIDKVTAVNDKIKGSFSGLTDTIKKHEEGIKTVGVVSGVVFGALSGIMIKSISEAQEAQRVNAQLEAVLKSTNNAVGLTSETIKGYASSLQNTTGIADDVIGAGQNMLLTFTNIGGTVFPKATETLLDMATAMNGGAKPSAEALKGSAIQLGKALNDPIEGISALSRVGVTFTDQQKAQIEQMVKMGDVAGAQKIILAELNREFGGSAAAQAATFEGRMSILRETMNGIYETIGTALLPVLTGLLTKVTPIITRVSEWIEHNPKLTAGIIAVVGGIAGLIAAASGITLILPSITAGLGILGTVIGVLTGPVGLVIAAIVALGVAWKTNFLGIQDWTNTAWQVIKDGFAAFKALFSGDFEGFSVKIVELVQNFIGNIKEKFPNFYQSFSDVWTKIEDVTIKILARIAIFVAEKALAIANSLQKMKDTLVEIATLGMANTKTYNPESTGSGTPPPRAFGGTVRGGQPYQIGENGPEIFVPAGNGRIINNADAQTMGNSVINISFGDVQVSKESDIDSLVNKISQVLGRQYKLSQNNIN